MKIILRRFLIRVAESAWNGWPDVHGISGRIAVDWVAECAWNQWPNDRGIRTNSNFKKTLSVFGDGKCCEEVANSGAKNASKIHMMAV